MSKVTEDGAGAASRARGKTHVVTSRASLDKRPQEVAAMFDAVARRYDRTNTFMSLGQDHRWRRRTRQSLELCPGERVLDLAAAQRLSTIELAQTAPTPLGCDFSTRHAAGRPGSSRPPQRPARRRRRAAPALR